MPQDAKISNPQSNPTSDRREAARRWARGDKEKKSSPPDEATQRRMQRLIAAAAQGKERFYQQWKKEFPKEPQPSTEALGDPPHKRHAK
jgi:hypothetical protein